VQQDGQGQMRVPLGQCSHLRLDRRKGGPVRVGVDVALGCALLLVPLDTEPEEVQALVDVGDQGLLRRQAQAHRGQDLRDLFPERLSVALGARDHQAPVVRIPDQPVGGKTFLTALRPLPGFARGSSRRPGYVPVQGGKGPLLSNGDRIPPCGQPVLLFRSTWSSPRIPALRNAFTRASTRLSPIRLRTPVYKSGV